MTYTRVFRDRKVGRQREFLKDAADAELPRSDHRVVGLRGTQNFDRAGIRSSGAGKNVHQGRLAGSVVADEADAFAGMDDKVHAIKRANGAETLFDAAQFDDVAWFGHSSIAAGTGQPDFYVPHFLTFASIAAFASSRVYSWLATPHCGMLGSSASNVSCVKAR